MILLFLPETHPAIASLTAGKAYSDVIMGFYRPNEDFVWLLIDGFWIVYLCK